MDKVEKFNKLINKMALCNKCINMKNRNGIDCSLINIEKQLTDTIKKQSYFKVDNIVIIPLYHPTAQVKREIQLQQYEKIWNFI
mgnify:CR=1 FL=1